MASASASDDVDVDDDDVVVDDDDVVVGDVAIVDGPITGFVLVQVLASRRYSYRIVLGVLLLVAVERCLCTVCMYTVGDE